MPDICANDDHLIGDLRERGDGGFDGWCWAPGRPDARMVVDLLVDDTLAVSMVAAIFRRDLMTLGYGDGRHGFAMRLPGDLAASTGEQLITARERRSGKVFGRVLRLVPGFGPVGGVALQRVDADASALWQRLDAIRAGRAAPPAARLRHALGDLAHELAARAGTSLRAGPTLALPEVATPRFSIVLAADTAASAYRRAAALAPALAAVAAELILVDPGHDASAALLPGRLRNLRYLRAAPDADPCAAALPHARGEHLLLLDRYPAEPSAAGLLAFARVATASSPALWLGADLSDTLAQLHAPARVAASLPGRLGLRLCVPRALLAELGPPDAPLIDGAGLEWADLAFKARLLGIAVHGVSEPQPADPADALPPVPRPATLHRARAAFHRRWGEPTTRMLDRAGRDA
jgi:hypothetical protein